ncbi:hypothetical protein TNCV_4725211 [Trichonephila clavipes]|uniref:Uncharacterized protein n=1 Tax=Trichonephila clavipes TaxID=2585209 RepID=A0A8X6W743_TRICX|nr:hypothetical protein TNCV_4725211 [Trichonephila clavipes]
MLFFVLGVSTRMESVYIRCLDPSYGYAGAFPTKKVTFPKIEGTRLWLPSRRQPSRCRIGKSTDESHREVNRRRRSL